MAAASAAVGRPDSRESFLGATSELSARMNVFELRFGRRPQSLPPWRGLRTQAAELLKRVDGQYRKERYYNADSAEIGTCVLLEMVGESDAALRRLDEFRSGGKCGNWRATVMLAVNRQRAGIVQRQGDYRKAFALMKDARDSMRLALSVPSPDIFYCQYAFLAGKNGRAAEGTASYQRVVDLWPHTMGNEIARKALMSSGKLIEPDLDRIRRLYLEDHKNRKYEEAISAIAAHKFPGAFDFLAGQLKTAEIWERNRIILALGALGEARAVPILRSIVEDGSGGLNTLQALAVLGRLGNREMVVHYLERMAKGKEHDRLFDGNGMDSVLREIYGDGPEPVSKADAFTVPPADLALYWLQWIEGSRSSKAEEADGKAHHEGMKTEAAEQESDGAR